MPDLKTIRLMRKQLDWTQLDLAREVGITQSMINKIEKGTKIPSFETASKIFQILSKHLSVQSGKPGIAREISVKYILYLKPDDTVDTAIKKLGSEIDQLPVIENDVCIGSLSSKKIMTLIGDSDFKKRKVREVMEQPFPVIGEEENLTKIRKLLEMFDAILTSDKGKLTGIITKSDLLKVL
jgi:predicted transcriptional regulator